MDRPSSKASAVRLALALVFAASMSAAGLRAQRVAEPPPPAWPAGTTAEEAAAFEAAAAKTDQLIPWITDNYALTDGPGGQFAPRKKKNDPDRLALLDQALAKAKETKRLVLWYAPRILASDPKDGAPNSPGCQMYRPALPHRYMQEIFWTDPEIAALVNAKFVPAKIAVDAKVGERFGVKALAYVEPAIILLDPEGKIVASMQRIRTFNADWLLAWLERSLAASGDFGRPAEPGDSAKTNIEKAAAAMNAGDYDRAADLLAADLASAEPKTAGAAHLLSAKIARRRRVDAKAAEHLDQAMKLLPEGDALRTDAIVERARGAIARAQYGEAAKALGTIAAAPASAGRAEGRYLSLVLAVNAADEAAIGSIVRDLVKTEPASPYTARAVLTIKRAEDTTYWSALRHNFESWTLPPEAAFEGASNTTHARLTDQNTLERARLAAKWLLDHQAKNGAWSDARYAYWDSPKIIPNVWMAVTALSATALLEWRMLAPADIDRALEVAESYIMDDSLLAPGSNEECYSNAYRILYLTRRIELTADQGQRLRYLKKMDEIIDALAKLQSPAGAWHHEYNNPFTTGAIIQILANAKKVGAHVPDEVMKKGTAALKKVRDTKRGAFAYGGPNDRRKKNAQADEPKKDEPEKPVEIDTSDKDAMARMPVCESALVMTQNGDMATLGHALDNWWKYFDRLETIRKCDFHTDGELGGFFFWHAFYHATEAAKAFDAPRRRAEAGKFMEQLLKMQEIDGTFIDSHELGKSYGTAMGLLSLKNCQTEE